MRVSTPLRTSVVKRGEKQPKLAAFIASHLATPQHGEASGSREVLLLARSVESPVVQAVASSVAQILAAGSSIRMILAIVDRGTLPSEWFLSESPRIDCDVRWVRNRRLLEAHEQLVLAPATCWIGDSMRRDPSKCDAYETYVEGDASTASSARMSFERLWAVSEQVIPSAFPLPPAFGSASFARTG